MNKIGFEAPEEEEHVEYIEGLAEPLDEEHVHLESFWSEGYTVALPRYLWAIILTLIVGFASGILRLKIGRL